MTVAAGAAIPNPSGITRWLGIYARRNDVQWWHRSLMIYSKFGSPLTLVTKTQSDGGQVSVQATTGNSSDLHDYKLADLKADSGLVEINDAVAKLPMKVFENTSGRRRRM